jgi:hypothetical protein
MRRLFAVHAQHFFMSCHHSQARDLHLFGERQTLPFGDVQGWDDKI